MNELNLIEISKELLMVNDEFLKHTNGKVNLNVYELEMFPQWWGNTCGGFQGIGGSAMTKQTTYVLVPHTFKNEAYVFFGGKFAYKTKVTDKFLEDLKNKNIAGLYDKSKYDI